MNTSLLELLQHRTSVRQYTDQPISDDLLQTLLTAAARTQTMGNLQLYSVIVTRDTAQKERLAPLHFNQPMVTQAPVVLTICADFRRTTLWCQARQAKAGYDNLLSFINATADALLYTQTLSSLAEEAGLGLCYLGTAIYNAAQIAQVLGLPALVFPVAALTIGWPAERPACSDRLPIAAFVHQETYHDYTPTDIDVYYALKEAQPGTEAYVAQNNKQTLAQVYAEVRYTKEINEKISETLMQAMRQQGFCPQE